MQETNLFYRFAAALVIGLLIGLQRQYASYEEPGKKLAAGIRTFSLISLIGCSSAFLSDLINSPLPLISSLIILAIFFAVNYSLDISKGKTGLTTEVAAILTCIIGAMVYYNQIIIAAALGVATTVLLSVKLEMHRFVKHLTRADIYATLKFAVITAIVLPLLPNQNYGPEPFNIFNPFKIWLLVIFISGISFVGYILIKVAGPRKGIGLTGFLGGLASSTAVTLSFTQRSTANISMSPSFALAIIISWTVMFSRVLIEVAALNMMLIRLVWLPIVAAGVIGLLYCIYLFKFRQSAEPEKDLSFSNPFELGPAIQFGLIFIIIMLITKVAQVYLGDAGIYLSSFISGLADVDAIALSMAQLSQKTDGISLQTAARAVIIATIANTVAKGSIVLAIGSSQLRRNILPGFLLMLITSGVFIFFI